MEEQREQDIEGHITLGDNIAHKQQWSKSETVPALSKDMTDSNLEAVKSILFPEIIEENNNLKEEIQQQQEQIESLMDENGSLRNIVVDKELEIKRCKEKLEKLQKLFSENPQEEVTVITDGLDFVFDVTHFNEYIRIDQIHFLFLQLQKLADIKIEPDKYLLDNASAIVPIFILLTQSVSIPTIYRYEGNMRDFCNEWNSNVVAYIKDKERAKALTCDYENFKRENSKEPWTSTSPATWRKDIINSRSKLKLNRAVNIKIQLEKLLKTITSPCKQAV